jgi:TPR repeat protein
MQTTTGVEAYRSKNYAAARLHWTRAIDHGELSALNNLGYLLYNGLGVRQTKIAQCRSGESRHGGH